MADQIVEPAGSHEPTEFAKTPKKAAASGWIGSALEYYDFFIYAQAAALVFPIIFFKQDNPKMNIVIALATFGVGYVARPIGAFVLGHWGVVCGDRDLGADHACGPAIDPGLCGRRRTRRGRFDDHGALTIR